MDLCNVELCINKRDGTKQVFSEPAAKRVENTNLKTLVNSLQKLQKEANAELTVMVEKEKSVISANCIKQSQDSESDDENEEDEDDEINGEPLEKKVKR